MDAWWMCIEDVRTVYEDVFSYLVGVERSNTGDLAAPVDTELREGDDFDDVDEYCDYYVDDTSYEAGMNSDTSLKNSNYFLFV